MRNRFSRRHFLTALLASAAVPAVAQPPKASLRPTARAADFFKRAVPGFENILAEARLDASIGFAVVDVRTGTILEEHRADTGIAPASVTKAVTAVYALETLGAGHRFQTRLIATGPVQNGVLTGDLVLAGGGDPTLDTDDLGKLAAALKAAGVREVRGAFRVADGALPRVTSISSEQPDHVGYSPAISGIALNFNRVHFEWRRGQNGYGVTMDARTQKYRPEVSMAKMRVIDRRTPIYTYSDERTHDAWTVARGALGKGGARWLPVRKPDLYAGDVFRTLARSNGIVLPQAKLTERVPAGTVLSSHQSAPLQDILKDMLRYSTNLTAEMVGLSATQKRVGRVTNLRASANEMNKWARGRFGVSGIDVVDHSGLGSKSRMTASAMAKALQVANSAGQLRPILRKISIKDTRGRPIPDHPLNVAAKTGTLNFVSCLAGFVEAEDGTDLAFAIFAADEKTRSRIGKANREAPQGARPWNRRAKQMQQALIERWGTLYGS